MAEIKNLFLPDSLVVVSNVSPDKQVITSLVQNLQVELPLRPKSSGGVPVPVGRGLGDPPLAASQTASFYVQFAGDESEVAVGVRIMGHVDLESGSKATLVSRIAGLTFSDDLTCAAKDGDFELSHTVKLTPGNGLLLTFFLLVDRSVTDGALPAAFASVESVEFNLDISPQAT